MSNRELAIRLNAVHPCLVKPSKNVITHDDGEKEMEYGVQYDSIWGKFLNAEKHLERIPQFLIF